MLSGVEVVELVDPVEHIGDQLLEEDPGSDPDSSTQRVGDRVRELGDVVVATRCRTRDSWAVPAA